MRKIYCLRPGQGNKYDVFSESSDGATSTQTRPISTTVERVVVASPLLSISKPLSTLFPACPEPDSVTSPSHPPFSLLPFSHILTGRADSNARPADASRATILHASLRARSRRSISHARHLSSRFAKTHHEHLGALLPGITALLSHHMC
jgi:hypothetical protein